MKLVKGKAKIRGAVKAAALAKMAGLGLGVLAVGGAGGVFGPGLVEKVKESMKPKEDTTEVVVSPADGSDTESEAKGFTMGNLPADEAVNSIVITVTAGKESGDLEERVDVHLGTGFPFRLFPVGSDSRKPSFAAFPQKSSLARGENKIPAGGSATFEFFASGESGQDALDTTPQLLKDLTVGDLQAIGFASGGLSDWALGAYKIEVNGKLFAENDSVNIRPKQLLDDQKAELENLVPGHEVLLSEIANLESCVTSGLATAADKKELDQKKAEAEKAAEPLTALAGKSAGYYPWYVEADEKFTPAKSTGTPVTNVEIMMVAAGGAQPGTKNPLYIKAGGKKFLLTSETDPLSDSADPQTFIISAEDLANSPLTSEELAKAGIGLVGNEDRFGTGPDRAKVQRLAIKANGVDVFDSEKKTDDRRALATYWLVPPAHFDSAGNVVKNAEAGDEKYLWQAGMIVPADIAKLPDLITPEPIPDLDTINTPDAPVVPDAPVDLAGDAKDPKKPDETAPDNTPVTPSVLGTTNPATPGNTQITPTVLGVTNPATTLGGTVPGVFTPTGGVNPLTGLSTGVFTPTTNTGLFSPVRRQTNSGLLPGLLNALLGGGTGGTTPGTGGVTPAQIAQIAAAVKTALQPATATTNQLTIANVRFSSNSNAVGDKPTVRWTITGDTSELNSYKVVLLPVLPHKRVPTVGDKVSEGVANGSATSARMGTSITLPPAGGFTPAAGPQAVQAEEWSMLYVRPRVTALRANGTQITAAEGAALPLFPEGTKTISNHGDFRLNRGITVVPTDDATSKTGGSFQIADFNTPSFTSWSELGVVNPVTSGNPLPAGTKGSAWTLNIDQGTVSATPFASPHLGGGNTRYGYSTAARTRGPNQETAILVYEGTIQYHDPTLPKPAGISSGKPSRGWRLVGHFGFLDGRGGSNGVTAQVGVAVELSAGRKTGILRNPIPIPRDKSLTNQDTAIFPALTGGAAAKGPFFTYGNNESTGAAGITITKTAGAPMQLLNIPIRFDLLDQGVGAPAYPTPLGMPARNFENTAANPNPVGEGAAAALVQTDYDAYNDAKANVGANPGRMTITVTIFIDTTAAPGDAVGIFGLRLVPDIYY